MSWCEICQTPLQPRGKTLFCPGCVMKGLFDVDDDQVVTLPTPPPSPPSRLPVVPRFTLIELIGEGGFAEVYRARQTEPVVREVAVKLLKGQMATADVLLRFEVERKTLARMEHPGIARLWDAGLTEAGQPFFAMELVRGEPVTRFCDLQHLDLHQRLEILRHICEAVQHAHEKGVLHRDLKPSNILVANGEVKIIDFGIAKAMSVDLETSDSVPVTGVHQMVGTPGYMSPEQADFGGRHIDARSDIYALGVILYELITGNTPLTVERLSGDKSSRWPVARMITPPSKVARSLLTSSMERRDLNAIALRALETESALRYSSAAALAEDVRRHLRCQPVTAAEQSLTYAAAKFARRHTSFFVSAAVVLTAIVAGFAVSTVLYLKEQASSAELSKALSRAHFGAAQRLKQEGDYQGAVASLTRALRQEPSLNAAAVDLQMLLTEDTSPQPIADAYVMDKAWGEIVDGAVSANGRVMVALCAKENTQRLMLLRHRSIEGWDAGVIDTPQAVTHLDLAAGGNCLAIADSSGRVRLWSVAENKLAKEWQAESEVRDVGVSLRTGFCAVGCKDGSVWMLSTDGPPATKVGSVQGAVMRLDIQDARVVAGGSSGEVKLFELGRETNGHLLFDLPAAVSCIATVTRPSLVAAGDAEGNVAVYSPVNGLLLGPMKQHEGHITALALTRQGESLITAGGIGDLQVKWMDVAKKAVIKPPLPSAGLVRGLLPTRSGDSVFVVQGDTSVRLWEANRASALTVRKPQRAKLLSLSRAGRAIGVMREWGASLESYLIAEKPALTRLCQLGPPSGPSDPQHHSLAFTPNSSSLTIAEPNGRVWHWGTQNVDTLGAARWFSPAMCIVHDSNDSVVAAMADGSLARVKLDGSAPEILLTADSSAQWKGADVASDGQGAAWAAFTPLANVECKVRTWWKGKTHSFTQDRLTAIAVHGARGWLALGLGNGHVRVVTCGGENVLPFLPVHQAAISSIEFSPDGNAIITGAKDGTAAVWTSRSLKPLTDYYRLGEEVTDVTFSGDSRRFSIVAGPSIAVGELAVRALIGQIAHVEGGPLDVALNHNGTCLAFGLPQGGAMLKDIAPSNGEPVPEWFLEFADANVSRRADAEGTVEIMEHPGATSIRRLIPPDLRPDHQWGQFADWMLAHTGKRTLSPWCKLTMDDYVEALSARPTIAKQAELRRLQPFRYRADEVANDK